jgi:hypothetical protein
MKMADEIITEFWNVKDAIAKEYGYDVKAHVADLRAMKREKDKRVIDLRSIEQATYMRYRNYLDCREGDQSKIAEASERLTALEEGNV